MKDLNLMNLRDLNEIEEVSVSREGVLGRIRLNRPKALNSLTLPMIRAIASALAAFEQDSAIAVVLIDGIGERAFCAGGDIRALYESGKRGDAAAAAFWAEEYALNAAIARFPKPYVAFMDGITMGGGVGLSAHGKHRLVTERIRLAMPETGIGFFPDIGATWLLPRAPSETGMYLGLTGTTINGADAIYARLADIEVASAALPEIVKALSLLAPGAPDVTACLAQFAGPELLKGAPASHLAENRSAIDHFFAAPSLPALFANLERDGSPFAQTTLQTLQQKSPTSLILTHRLLRLGGQATSLQQCLDRECTAAARIMRGVDFYEGVRAAIIDKDRNPHWCPASIAEVDEAALMAEYIPG